eukprot:CAMPEP_0181119062 /NCGR_PEP_ID=MMETSP1071-20121207/23405_1 /TAXON_ID=35127 /ORGANISM="Thalassiosira sp., Strain NH16" /LENGTH=339 /DNA_ID=CAMNT_0023203591 /DNA_START=75 /DNA_END=1094 /DNA_ORIENTATION=-
MPNCVSFDSNTDSSRRRKIDVNTILSKGSELEISAQQRSHYYGFPQTRFTEESPCQMSVVNSATAKFGEPRTFVKMHAVNVPQHDQIGTREQNVESASATHSIFQTHDIARLQTNHASLPLINIEGYCTHTQSNSMSSNIVDPQGDAEQQVNQNDPDVVITEDANQNIHVNDNPGTSCSFGTCNSAHEDSGAIIPNDNASNAQSSYDFSFGREKGQLEQLPVPDFHDCCCYYDQETGLESEAENDKRSPCQPLYGVYFGLDENDSSLQSQLEMGSLSYSTMNQSILFHDYYFGKEGDIKSNDPTVAAMIPRCTMQSKPLSSLGLKLGVLIFAGIMSRAL